MKWNWMMGVAVASSGVLVACADKSTAGSTFETENSVATVVVFHADGTPAAYSHVQVCERDAFVEFLGTGLSNVGESYETDSAGTLKLKNLKPGDYIVEAQADLENDSILLGAAQVSIPSVLPDSSIPISVEVEEPSVISGHVDTDMSPAYVMVRGTRHVQAVSASGDFSMQIPRGDFEILLVYKNQVIASDSVTVEVNNEPLVLTDTLVREYLFEDFEDSSLAWYVSYSKYATATLEWTEAGEGRDGMVAHFTCENDSVGHWALMGRSFGRKVDLSAMDSISFWIRGGIDNYISLAFDVLEDSTSTYTSGKSWVHIDVPSEWSRIVVTPDSLLAADSIGGNIGWDAVKDHVTNLSIFGGAGGEIWIDDIVFYGVDWE
ncbi:MAG: hypothetical protein J6Z31_09695 [Fibrobacter sp.]|nr:hypothetical protein [Fibrobacter sp.]